MNILTKTIVTILNIKENLYFYVIKIQAFLQMKNIKYA